MIDQTIIQQRKSSRANSAPLNALTDRHRQIIALFVHGKMNDQEVANHLGVKPGWVHGLRSEPLFKVEFDRAMQAKRDGYKPEALERQAKLMRSDNEMVALAASKALLDEPGKATAPVNVAVQVNNEVDISALSGRELVTEWLRQHPRDALDIIHDIEPLLARARSELAHGAEMLVGKPSD